MSSSSIRLRAGYPVFAVVVMIAVLAVRPSLHGRRAGRRRRSGLTSQPTRQPKPTSRAIGRRRTDRQVLPIRQVTPSEEGAADENKAAPKGKSEAEPATRSEPASRGEPAAQADKPAAAEKKPTPRSRRNGRSRAAEKVETVGEPLAPGMMKLLQDEIVAGIKSRGITDRFARFQSYAIGKVNSSAGRYTGSELAGNCRLKWYDHLMRNMLAAPAEAEQFTRELHTAAVDDHEGLAKVLAIAAVKMDARPRGSRARSYAAQRRPSRRWR